MVPANPPTSDLANALRNEVDRLERELEQSLTRKQQLEAVIGVLRKEKETIQAQIDEGSARTQKMYRVLADLETQRQQLEDKIAQRQGQVSELEGCKATLERELAQTDRLREETVALERENGDRQAAIELLRQREQGLLTNCARLEAQVAELSDRTVALTRSLAATAREQQTVEATLNQQRTTLDQIRTQADAHHRRRHELRQQIEALQQQYDGLPSTVAKLQAEHDRLVAHCRDRQGELNQLYSELAQARAEHQTVQAELTRDRQARDQAAAQAGRDGGSLRLWLSLLLKDFTLDRSLSKPRRIHRKSSNRSD